MRTSSLLLAAVVGCWLACAHAQVHLQDETDRAAFLNWFVVLVDAQYYSPTPDVTDCAGLVRHAVREALRPHTSEWLRKSSLPGMPVFPDVRRPPRPHDGVWPLFRVAASRYAEFADARTLVRYNASALGRSVAVVRPGDLLFFHQDSGPLSDHLMVFVGGSAFDRSATDWVVYHTGPDGARAGEVRKVRLVDLEHHPAPRWRPLPENPVFVGVFRLALL
jgi:uncharacterized protein YfaT (DUF1175 family)